VTLRYRGLGQDLGTSRRQFLESPGMLLAAAVLPPWWPVGQRASGVACPYQIKRSVLIQEPDVEANLHSFLALLEAFGRPDFFITEEAPRGSFR
jgi:hypothetical protein